MRIEPVGGQLGTSSSSSVPVIGSVISIADLYGFVKRFDKDFTVAHDVSEAVLNKDGTPKVFYHGTDSDFSSFSYGHIGNATGVGILGDGFYFSDKKSLAEGYGKRLYPCYLQMQNPYFATDNDAYRLNAEKLQQQEYDGVVLEAPKGNVYMVLDNTQIKSAETGENENIGTFDRAEGNIYHSVPSSETSNQQTSDDSAEAKRKARQEQAALAGELWHEAAQIHADSRARSRAAKSAGI